MADELAHVTLRTDWGWICLLGSAAGVRRLILPQPSPEAARRMLAAPAATAGEELFPGLVRRLRAYFRGEPVGFRETIDLRGATDFQRRVWTAARLIPYGRTVTYGRLAAAIGQPGAARAVGQALHRNPVPIIIPCHRIISGDGSPGGFGGGVDTKRRLLALEKAGVT